MFARYEVDWYMDKSITSKGFVQASDFTEAVQKIEADYDDIEAIRIEWISEGSNCLDDDDIVDYFDTPEQGAGNQVFEAIKEGLKEAIEYEELERKVEK